MPLLRSKPGATPADHEVCRDDPNGGCLQCKAEANLTASDWAVLHFFGLVSDQIVNLGHPDGQPHFVPRLDVWLAALDLIGCDDPAERFSMIEQARFLFSYVEEHVERIPGLFTMPVEALMPEVVDG